MTLMAAPNTKEHTMTRRTITRGIAAGAATTIAVGALALLGTGIAGADPATTTWDDWYSRFTRTVSNSTPAAGDTITVSTKFERTNSTSEKLSWVKDFHHSCLTYVPDSAKLTDTSGDHPVEPYLQISTDFIAGDFNATSYPVIVENQTESPTFSAQYKVGDSCPRDTALTSGMDYSGSLGAGSYSTNGPSITVAKTTSTTTLAPITGATIGKTTVLTATIAPADAGGTVTFKDGDAIIGTAAVGNDGKATSQWSPATDGNRTITAEYSGTNTVAASTTHITATVAPEGSIGGGNGSLGDLLGGFGSS